jgi:hypothetical protein
MVVDASPEPPVPAASTGTESTCSESTGTESTCSESTGTESPCSDARRGHWLNAWPTRSSEHAPVTATSY